MLKNNVKLKLIVAYKCRQTSFYCTLLYCTSQILCFLQIEGLWQPNIEQGCQCNFPSSICSFCVYRSVQFSSVTSAISDSLQPHGLQHTRLPCPSPTTGACSNSCQSSQRCHLTISSSVVPFSSCFQSFPGS